MHRAPLRALAACAAVTIAVMTQAPTQASAAPPESAKQGLAKGRLVYADGRPAAGALITLYAYPVETAENHFEEGDSGTFEVIAQFRADKQGRYAAAVKRADLARFRDPAGNLNAELVARDSSGQSASMTLGLAPAQDLAPQDMSTATGRAAVSTTALIPVSVADLTLASGSEAATKNATASAVVSETATQRSSGDPATRQGDPGNKTAKAWVSPMSKTDAFVDGADASAIVLVPAVVCGWSLVQDLGPRQVWVGGTYVTTTGVTADLVYSSGASSSLGVGVSASGSYGSFSASGTTSRSSEGSQAYPAHSSRQHAYTDFRYGKFGYWCDTRPGYSKYQVYARYWSGGADYWTPPSAPTANYCVGQRAGTTFTKSTSTAYSFSTGADISGAIGIDLSSRTGYSTTAKVTYAFTYSRRMCGTSGDPGYTPGRLVAKT